MISKRCVAARDPIRIARWKKVVEIAKILLEEDGYHSAYLDDLLEYATKAISTDSDDAKKLNVSTPKTKYETKKKPEFLSVKDHPNKNRPGYPEY